MIADFFRTETDGVSPISGGHRLRTFYEQISHLSFIKRTDIDITAETAPTVALFGGAMSKAVRPIWQMSQHYLQCKRPWLFRFLYWMFRRKIERFERKQLGDAITPESFAKFKSYRIMLYQTPALPRPTGRNDQDGDSTVTS